MAPPLPPRGGGFVGAAWRAAVQALVEGIPFTQGYFPSEEAQRPAGVHADHPAAGPLLGFAVAAVAGALLGAALAGRVGVPEGAPLRALFTAGFGAFFGGLAGAGAGALHEIGRRLPRPPGPLAAVACAGMVGVFVGLGVAALVPAGAWYPPVVLAALAIAVALLLRRLLP